MWGTIIIYIIQYFMCTYGDDLRGLGPGTWQLWLGVRACAVRQGNLTQCGFVFVHIVENCAFTLCLRELDPCAVTRPPCDTMCAR